MNSMTTNITPMLRLAQPADIPQLAQLYYETVVQNGGQYYTEAQIQAWANFARDEAAFAQFVDGVTTFVVEADGAILGFAGLARDGHVTAVYVRCDRIGQGIGSRLMETLLNHADTGGIHRLYAEASEFSLRLFLKFGFQQFDTEVIERDGVEFQRYLVEKKITLLRP
jgi:putative acetyltransferase